MERLCNPPGTQEWKLQGHWNRHRHVFLSLLWSTLHPQPVSSPHPLSPPCSFPILWFQSQVSSLFLNLSSATHAKLCPLDYFSLVSHHGSQPSAPQLGFLSPLLNFCLCSWSSKPISLSPTNPHNSIAYLFPQSFSLSFPLALFLLPVAPNSPFHSPCTLEASSPVRLYITITLVYLPTYIG